MQKSKGDWREPAPRESDWREAKRPKPEPSSSRMKIAVWIAGLASLVPLVALAATVGKMPDQIPMHYNFFGEVDRYGSPYELWILAIILALLAAAILIIVRYPQSSNTIWEPRSAAGYRAFYRLSRILIIGMSLWCTALNLALVFALPGWLPIGWVVALLIAIVPVLIVFTLQLRRVAQIR